LRRRRSDPRWSAPTPIGGSPKSFLAFEIGDEDFPKSGMVQEQVTIEDGGGRRPLGRFVVWYTAILGLRTPQQHPGCKSS
jgi:hypothetical protein